MFDTFMGAYLAIFLSVAIFLWIPGTDDVDFDAVRKACVAHEGVNQVVRGTFPVGPDDTVVVCRDGFIAEVED